MKKLDLTDQEISDILKSDEAIDNGARLFELDEDSKKAVRLVSMSGHDNDYPDKRKGRDKKPPNNEKIEMIKAMAKAVKAEEVQIEHPERIFTFVKNGVKYKVVLSCPRS